MSSIEIVGRFPDESLTASIGIDCCGTARDYVTLENAKKAGFQSKGVITDGESLLIAVEAGPHEIFAFNKKSVLGLCALAVAPGRKYRVLCSTRKLEKYKTIENGKIEMLPGGPKEQFYLTDVTDGVGIVSLETRFAKNATVTMCIGERWYKNCHPCPKGIQKGFSSDYEVSERIKSGVTKQFEVSAGKQSMFVSGGEFLVSDKLSVDMRANEVVKVLCTDNLSFAERTIYPLIIVAKNGNLRPYYRLEEIQGVTPR